LLGGRGGAESGVGPEPEPCVSPTPRPTPSAIPRARRMEKRMIQNFFECREKHKRVGSLSEALRLVCGVSTGSRGREIHDGDIVQSLNRQSVCLVQRGIVRKLWSGWCHDSIARSREAVLIARTWISSSCKIRIWKWTILRCFYCATMALRILVKMFCVREAERAGVGEENSLRIACKVLQRVAWENWFRR
jgi:hypothetical protein